MLFQLAGHLRWATGTRTISQPLDALVGKAMHPFPQGRIRKLERVGDVLDTLSFDDIAYSLGTAQDTYFFGLFQEDISGEESSVGKVQFEGAHAGGLHNKVLQKYNRPTSHHVFTLLSARSLSDSNFPEAAYARFLSITVSNLSQASLLGGLSPPHDAFQGHAAHPPRWFGELSHKGSSGTCIPEGEIAILICRFHGAPRETTKRPA